MNKRRKNKIYFVVSAVLCSLIITSLFNIVSVVIQKNIQQQDTLYNYQTNGSIDYKVYLINNDFIKSDYLDKNKYYISQLVNYISTDFNYKFSGDSNAKIEYSYYLKGILSGNYMDNTVGVSKTNIWIKEYKLQDIINKSIDNKTLEINENLKIDLNPFNVEVEKFKQELGIPISAKLTIQLNVSIKGLINNKSFTETDNIYIDIPLNTAVFKIDGPFNISNNRKILKSSANESVVDYQTIINSIVFIVSLFSLVIVLKKINNNSKSPYRLKLNKILNEYGNRIVIIKNFLNMPEENYVNVVNFDELIDLVDELNIPILCLIRHTRELCETWFMVINEKIVYRYILSVQKEIGK